MNVAILHYHFNRGGVTQVVLNHLQALDLVLADGEQLRVALIHGGRTGGISDDRLTSFQSLQVSAHALPSLDYDDGRTIEDEKLASEIRAILKDAGFSPAETLLHVHNHSLGKNISLPGAIPRLARDGYRCLLQIHDFAEDLRPANFRRLAESLGDDSGNPSTALYPLAAQVHYAVLNGRDFQLLGNAGLPSDNLHRLPNAAGEFGELPAKEVARQKLEQRFNVPHDAKYILYPVRGIRRKNVGEALLWSALAPENCVVGVTLAPQNPTEQQLYNRWKQLAADLELPCVFETGGDRGLEFQENLAAADRLLTTSVAEGFGLVFLEAWLAGRDLVGRDLPEITADFVEAGISLDRLYPQLWVPTGWVGADDLRESLTRAYHHLLGSYGFGDRIQGSVERQLSPLLTPDRIDFGMLDSSLQARVIQQVHGKVRLREKLWELNPRLCTAVTAEPDKTRIAANGQVVREVYSLEASGKRLKQIYSQVMDSRLETDIHCLPCADRILNEFLDVTRLHPVRFEE